jgi:hypothetical protein
MALDIVAGLTATQEGINRLKPAAEPLVTRLFRLVPDRALSQQVCPLPLPLLLLPLLLLPLPLPLQSATVVLATVAAAVKGELAAALADPAAAPSPCLPCINPHRTLCTAPALHARFIKKALAALVNLAQDDDARGAMVKLRAVSRVLEAIREKSCPHLHLLVGMHALVAWCRRVF